MSNVRVIEINKSVYAANEATADETRAQLREKGTFLLNVMASPGAGKTTTILKTMELLKQAAPDLSIGVMEADIDATVDAEKIQAAGAQAIQVHTGGECAMNADMTRQALDEMDDLPGLLFLENVGNLVCPAEEDVGSMASVAILSLPEGDDKPLKYPLMFSVVDAVLINKIDTREYFGFDDAAVVERIHKLNPEAPVFFICAKTGEGMADYITWLCKRIETFRKNF